MGGAPPSLADPDGPFASSPELLCLVGAQDRLTFANGAWLTRLGRRPESLVGADLEGLIHSDDLVRLLVADGDGPLAGRLDGRHCRVRHADGSYRELCWTTWQEDGDVAAWGRAAPAEDEDGTGEAPAPGGTEATGLVQTTLDALAAHVAVVDATGEIVLVNTAWTAFAQANLPDSGDDSRLGVGANYLEVCAEAKGDPLAGEVAAGLRDVIAGRRDHLALEYPCHAPTTQRWFRIHAIRSDASGQTVVAHENITDRRLAAEGLQFRARLLQDIDTPVVVMAPDSTVLEWNPAAERLYGRPAAEAAGRRWVVLGDDGPERERHLRRLLQLGYAQGERDSRRDDGTTGRVLFHSLRLDDDAGEVLGIVDVAFDITAHAEAERRLRGARDYLRAVTDEMGEGLLTLDAEGRVTSMNREAQRLLGRRSENVVGQSVGAVTGAEDPGGDVAWLLDSPIDRTRHPTRTIQVDDDIFVRGDGRPVEVRYTCSPFVTEDGIDGWVLVFSDITAQKAEERRLLARVRQVDLVQEIRAALGGGRMVLHAQPIIDLRSRRTVQHELLVRMLGADGGLVDPGVFLPAAERFGLIREVDRWVVKQAVQLAAGGRPVQVNLSASSLSDPDLPGEIVSLMDRHGADPGLLVFELTETGILEDPATARRFMEQIREAGATVALDDFGTGYSGFSYLKHLPVSFLKIDIDFVRDLRTSTASQHVVRAVVDLAHGFGIHTIGEGVEDDATVDALADFGVDFAQGYAIGRPLPLAEAFAVAPVRDS